MVDLASLVMSSGPSVEFSNLKVIVDRRLVALLPPRSRAGELNAALHYSLLAPGKRIRPLLTLLAAWEIGPENHAAVDAGCAIEMVHAASLIFDDMPAMDDAQERRGQPATHIKFGEDVALLSAITLLSQAYATVGAMDGVDAATRCALVGILAKAVGTEGLTGGQYADLRPSTLKSPKGIARANHLKTGALFIAAVEMAAAIHRASERETDRLRCCAAELGQAFQLMDDLIDSVALVGPGRPEDAGKATLLSLLGQGASRRRLRGHVEKALAGLRPEGHLARFIASFFRAALVQVEAA